RRSTSCARSRITSTSSYATASSRNARSTCSRRSASASELFEPTKRTIMDVNNNDAAPAGGAPIDIVQIPAPAGEAISTRDAARSLASFRLKQREGEHESRQQAQDLSRPAAHAEAAPPADESAEASARP